MAVIGLLDQALAVLRIHQLAGGSPFLHQFGFVVVLHMHQLATANSRVHRLWTFYTRGLFSLTIAWERLRLAP